MLDVYSLSQKFNKIRIFVFCDTTKIWKKIKNLKKSEKYILRNNNAEKLLKIAQETYFFFISNEFIDFLESFWIFSIFTFLKILKN